jgi:hypothetical protein
MQDNAKIAGYNPDASDNGYALGFFTAPSAGQMTERLTISRAGNVGIGTASVAEIASGAKTVEILWWRWWRRIIPSSYEQHYGTNFC